MPRSPTPTNAPPATTTSSTSSSPSSTSTRARSSATSTRLRPAQTSSASSFSLLVVIVLPGADWLTPHTSHSLLAEHMLPDGAHDHPEDWTVFYLNQVPGLIVDPAPLAQARADLKGKARAVDEDAATPAADDGVTLTASHDEGGLLFVMSLVRTKKDASVRRCVALHSVRLGGR